MSWVPIGLRPSTLSLGTMGWGFVYFVFQPSIVTTLLAGKAVALSDMLGLPLMLSSYLADVLAGMVMVRVGAFFAQASATGFVGQAARIIRGVASGTYLACYFSGGLVCGAVLGQVYDQLG